MNSTVPIRPRFQLDEKSARGPIDNLYLSPDGAITVVETKLWKNPEKHRTVVAQVIEYANELATWGYDQLCAAVLASSRKRGEETASLEAKVATALSNADVSFTSSRKTQLNAR